MSDKLRQLTKKILERYPQKVPILLHFNPNVKHDLLKTRFIVDRCMTFTEFAAIIRKSISINESEGLYYYTRDTVVCMSRTIGEIYEEYKTPETGILDVSVACESTFGR